MSTHFKDIGPFDGGREKAKRAQDLRRLVGNEAAYRLDPTSVFMKVAQVQQLLDRGGRLTGSSRGLTGDSYGLVKDILRIISPITVREFQDLDFAFQLVSGKEGMPFIKFDGSDSHVVYVPDHPTNLVQAALHCIGLVLQAEKMRDGHLPEPQRVAEIDRRIIQAQSKLREVARPLLEEPDIHTPASAPIYHKKFEEHRAALREEFEPYREGFKEALLAGLAEYNANREAWGAGRSVVPDRLDWFNKRGVRTFGPDAFEEMVEVAAYTETDIEMPERSDDGLTLYWSKYPFLFERSDEWGEMLLHLMSGYDHTQLEKRFADLFFQLDGQRPPLERTYFCRSASLALDTAARYFADQGLTVAAQEPTFDNMFLIMKARKIELQALKEEDLLQHGLEHWLQQIQAPVLLLTIPNNPTGKSFSQREFEQIVQYCARHDKRLVIDSGGRVALPCAGRSWL